MEKLTVKELREMSRQRGLTLESKGHKFTKSELIERIKSYDNEHKTEVTVDDVMEEENKTEVKECSKDIETCAECEENPCENTPEKKFERKNNYVFATTLKQIAEKYSYKKPDYVLENVLQVGSTIAFIHCVEAKDQNIYRKLRFAKVIGVNRKKEIVKIETFYGTQLVVPYDELLFILGKDESTENFPMDIRTYIKKHRTLKGKKDIHDRYISSNRCEE